MESQTTLTFGQELCAWFALAAIAALVIWVILREQAGARTVCRPEGWLENQTLGGFYWHRGGAEIGFTDDGVNRYVWTNRNGAIPLKVMVAFCARAKEWKQ